MPLLVRLTLSLTLVAGVGIIVSCSQPDWLGSLGLDIWNWPQLGQALAETEAAGEWLDGERRAAEEKTERKDEVVARLVAQKVKLADAATQILRLTKQHHLQAAFELLNIEGGSEHERVCRLLIYWAAKHLADQPDRAAEVTGRLKAELLTQTGGG